MITAYIKLSTEVMSVSLYPLRYLTPLGCNNTIFFAKIVGNLRQNILVQLFRIQSS
jgi:hypothetical protein